MNKTSRSFLALSLATLVTSSFGSEPRIDPALAGRLGTQSQTRVIVFLSRQHVAEAAKTIAPLYRPRIEAAAERLRLEAVRLRNMPTLSPEENEKALATGRYLVNPSQLAPFAREVDSLRSEYFDEAVRMARANSVWDFAAVEGAIARLGGRTTGGTLAVSTVFAVLPGSKIGELADHPMVALVAADNAGYPELDTSAASLGATVLWGQGTTGGVFDCGVLDTGVLQSHAAFAGKRFESGAGTGDSSGHGTHVAGIMASGNATYRGMAWGLDTISVAAAGNDSQSMNGRNYLMTVVTERAEAVNYSFGNGTANSQDYAPIDRFFDGVIDTFDTIVSKSTGNGGFSSGAPTITHPAPAFNLLACASLFDQGNSNRNDDRISSFSSTGPTVSGRKKPDIAGLGEAIMSTYNNGGYTSLSGTSMAAPHIGGSVVLMNQLGAASPLAAKAVLLNTTDAMDSKGTSTTADDTFVNGSFWDRRYGWGYVNLIRAGMHAPDVFVDTIAAPTAQNKSLKFYGGTLSNHAKLTLVWNRRVAYNGASYPGVVRQLSNLDLAAYRANGAFDLLGVSASTIDNVEQLSVGSSAVDVIAKVSTTGLFDPALVEDRYALATQENWSRLSPPNATGQFVRSLGSAYLAPFNLEVRVTNTGQVPIVDGRVELSAPLDILNGANPQPVGTIQPGQTVTAVWQVRRRLNPGSQPTQARVRSTGFGENWEWVLTDPNG
jgi:serine protease AprX